MSVPWANTSSGTMTALVLTSPGAEPASACFTYTDSYPKPSLPGPGWVLIRVRAAGVNRAELRSRAGQPAYPEEWNIWQKWYHKNPPKILGEDFVGEVVEAAPDTSFTPGEKVVASHYGGGKAFDGSYAQYVLAHKRRLWRLPQDTKLSWDILGSPGMPFLTAYKMAMTAGRLGDKPPGSAVIVHGATSSTGLCAILIAKDQGATVVATTRQRQKLDRLKQAGADYALLESDLDEQIPKILPAGADVIVELVGCDQTMRALGWTAPFGTVVISGILNDTVFVPNFSPVLIPSTRNLSFASISNDGIGDEDFGATAADIEPIFAYAVKNIESGKWKAEQFVDGVYALKDVGRAHERAEKNEAIGRMAFTVP